MIMHSTYMPTRVSCQYSIIREPQIYCHTQFKCKTSKQLPYQANKQQHAKTIRFLTHRKYSINPESWSYSVSTFKTAFCLLASNVGQPNHISLFKKPISKDNEKVMRPMVFSHLILLLSYYYINIAFYIFLALKILINF